VIRRGWVVNKTSSRVPPKEGQTSRKGEGTGVPKTPPGISVFWQVSTTSHALGDLKKTTKKKRIFRRIEKRRYPGPGEHYFPGAERPEKEVTVEKTRG